jgi:hypothetical protein
MELGDDFSDEEGPEGGAEREDVEEKKVEFFFLKPRDLMGSGQGTEQN